MMVAQPNPAASPTKFLDRQINSYGMPGRAGRRPQYQPPTKTPYMPNGAPTPAPQADPMQAVKQPAAQGPLAPQPQTLQAPPQTGGLQAAPPAAPVHAPAPTAPPQTAPMTAAAPQVQQQAAPMVAAPQQPAPQPAPQFQQQGILANPQMQQAYANYQLQQQQQQTQQPPAPPVGQNPIALGNPNMPPPLPGGALPMGQPGFAPPQPAPGTPQGGFGGGGLSPVDQQFQGNAGSVDAEGNYTPGSGPNVQYDAQHIGQYTPQNYQGMQDQQANLLQQLMASGGSMNPQVLAQMKGMNTDQAALLERQGMMQARDSMAARGFGGAGGGFGNALQRAIGGETNRNILNNNRSLDVQAAQQNFADQLNASGAAGQFQNDVANRGAQAYGLNLQGMGANRDEQLARLNSIYQNFGANQGMQQLASQSRQGVIGNRNQANQIGNQNSQFNASLGFDKDKFAYQQQQDAAQMAAQAAAAGSANSHWEDQMAFQYQQQNQQQYNNMLQYLFDQTGQY